MGISPAEVDDFIARFDSAFEGRLHKVYNYSRVVSLAWLDRLLGSRQLRSQGQVGVISGSGAEPELKLIQFNGVELLNFDQDRRFDLDTDWSGQPPRNFSLTLCNQVLEHVFDPHQAFRNVIHHTRPGGGLIFVSIPTINCIHGEPYFYSSGFHPRFLQRLADANQLEVIGLSHWGTPKYMLHAVTGTWLTDENLRPGFHGAHDFRFPNFVFADGRDPNDAFTAAMRINPVITDCWGLFARR
jgi:SAM-dependent methyltransferase